MSHGIFGGIGLVTGAAIGAGVGAVIGVPVEYTMHSDAKDKVITLQEVQQGASNNLNAVRLKNGNLLSLEIGERCIAVIAAQHEPDPSTRLAHILNADTDKACGNDAGATLETITRYDGITGSTTQAETHLNQVNHDLEQAKHDVDESLVQYYAMYGAIGGAILVGGIGLLVAETLENC